MTTSNKNPLHAISFIRNLMARGHYTFTLNEAVAALKVNEIAARAALRRLKAKNLIATPARGFYVIVSPEYEKLGCLPAEHFVADLMKHFRAPYYVGLLSAAELHGAAHQKPQEFQVVTNRNRKLITCGSVTIRFVARKRIERVPIEQLKTPRGFIEVSTPEATAFDLLLYPEHVGGLNNAATVLSELTEKMDPKKLKGAALSVPTMSSVQRTGFIFDRILKKERFAAVLAKLVKKKGKATIPLLASGTRKGVKIDEKWNVFVNERIEPDV